MKRTSWTAGLAGIGLWMLASEAFAQGSLTPPGAPAPTMKTLAQVEPRTPVTNAPCTLSQPGSYYLTTNLSGSVNFSANNITLDLMGFTIACASGSAIGQIGVRTNLVIRNGALSAPTGNGMDLSISTSGANGLIEDLRIDGCQNSGIVVGGGYTIRHCRIQGAGLAGIKAHGNSSIRGCTVTACGKGLQLTGTGALVEGNRVQGNTDNYDFAAGNQLNLLISEIPETLDWPCVARLAGSLTCTTSSNGITVNANDVTIDMAGHTLIGPGASSGYGIYQSSAYRNLRVFNGKAVNWLGSGKAGIYAYGSAAILSDLQVATNYHGIYGGAGSSLSGCAASYNGAYGIFAGGGSTLSGCAAYYNGSYGISAGNSCTLSGCAVSYNGSDGIYGGAGSTLSDCAAYNNTADGIRVANGCLVSSCTARFNGNGGDGAGIHVDGSDNRIEGNNVTLNDRGIDVGYSGNFIVRNIAAGNSTNWVVVAGNVCLVIQATTAGAISGNSGGTAPGSTDPNVNFTY